MSDQLTITYLEAENIKGLRAVQVHPNGENVILAGDNEAGKSTVLDAIEYVLGGGSRIPGKPLRIGESKGKIKITLGGSRTLNVVRTFNDRGKTTLKVVDEYGNTLTSPQKVLDEIYDEFTFDPSAFARMKPAEQRATLLRVAGVDLTEIDAEIARRFEHRKNCKRDAKTLANQVEAFGDTKSPSEKVDIAELAAKRSKLDEEKSDRADCAAALDQAANLEKQNTNTLRQAEAAMELSRTRVEKDRAIRDSAAERMASCRQPNEIDVDREIVTSQINTATIANAAYEAAATHRQIKADLDRAEKIAAGAEAAVTKARDKKAAMLGGIELPLPLLGITDDGVEIGGVPLDQCSQARTIEISTAIGLAGHPELAVMLLREGAFFDQTILARVCEMAHEAGCMLWIERIAKDEHTTLVIEDGTAREVV